MVSIARFVSSNLVDRITALSAGESRSGQAFAQALQGGAGGGEDKISRTIRFGAQAYATSLSGINFTASALNLAESDLEQLSALTNEALFAVSRASNPRASKEIRSDATRTLYSVGKAFDKIIDNAILGDKEYLTEAGLSELFVQIGLDPQSSKTVGKVFDTFIFEGSDNLLASKDIKGDTQNSSAGELFSNSRRINTAKEAIQIQEDLVALNNQIQTNLEGFKELRGVLAENAFLVRATSIAFSSVAEQINSIDDANDLAQALRKEISRNAQSVAAQAENLEPLIVAALTFEQNNLLE